MMMVLQTIQKFEKAAVEVECGVSAGVECGKTSLSIKTPELFARKNVIDETSGKKYFESSNSEPPATQKKTVLDLCPICWRSNACSSLLTRGSLISLKPRAFNAMIQYFSKITTFYLTDQKLLSDTYNYCIIEKVFSMHAKVTSSCLSILKFNCISFW